MGIYSIGSLGSSPITQNGFTLNTADPTDVFKFTSSGGNINLSLTNISAGDDADLALFRDANNNGVLDDFDREVGVFSLDLSNNDEAINFRSSSGTFFAEVSRFSSDPSGNVGYNLALSVTPLVPATEPQTAPLGWD